MTGNEHVGPSWFVARLAYGEAAAGTARRLVAELLRRLHQPPERIADATLVVHELVVNGLTHGAPDEWNQIEVFGRVEEQQLTISVTDQGNRGVVAAVPFTEDRLDGRGLSMVAALSSSWTVDRSSGTRVTATLSL